MTDLNNILQAIEKDLKNIVDEQYGFYYYTDYKKLLGERNKIQAVDFEDVWDADHEDMLAKMKRKTENLKTQISIAQGNHHPSKTKEQSKIDKYLNSQKGQMSVTRKSRKSKMKQNTTQKSRNSYTNSVVSPSMSRRNGKITLIWMNSNHFQSI